MSQSTTWCVIAHSSSPKSSSPWTEQLTQRLGYKPRRLSLFTQAALLGALSCLDNAENSDSTLNAQALTLIRMSTQRGTLSAAHKAIAEIQTGLPMPFTFLQSQISQALANLLTHLQWIGDASVLITTHDSAFIQHALIQAKPHGDVLLGWVEENFDDPNNNVWLYLRPCALPDMVQRVNFERSHIMNLRYFSLEHGNLSCYI